MRDPIALLLADPAPALRYRALVEVDGAPSDDPEVVDLAAQLVSAPEVQRVLDQRGGDIIQTSFRLCQLAYVGVGREHPAVEAMADELFAGQLADGSWDLRSDEVRAARVRRRAPVNEGYEWAPLQTALPLRGLVAAGFGTDARCERAFEWLLEHRLPDGSWPDVKAPGHRAGARAVPGYRRLPSSEGCRATTTGALACLAHHPERRRSDAARTALDLLLQRETRDEAALGFEITRLLGVEPARGFATFYGPFDLVLLLDLAGRVGISPEDARVAGLVAFLESVRGPQGLWEHPVYPHLSRWLTLDILASLRRLETGDWRGSRVGVPFRPYPKHRRRY